ncbi:hypothetical protein NHX12_000200 [Muraenolepis orangiensis]|uniref:Alpha-macroglobulin receptor-binding domain-containing protein n=1 Tax=Muraenolepis orangiensis TaxID=630683 RepID=A0A9Q0D6I4_9TELE|nr:hypothetical protein NHX12_000200 [Muraenolepis orangiensis]
MMETPLSYSCERRKEYVLDGNDCADAFFKCSETLAKLQAESKTEALYLARSLNHWPMANPHFTLEATAYALLALVKVKSTTMVYQALAEYWMDAQDNYDANSMDIDIKIAGHAETTSFRVNRENAMETRYTIYHIVSLYYKRPSSINTLNNCERFNITVVLEPVTQAEGANVYLLKIEIQYKNKDTDAGMTIVDISHLTGYMPDLEDLNRLSSGRDKTIQMYLIDTSPSEKVSLIIYLDKVSHTVKDEIAFKIKQTMPVGVLQPAVISIYEYDEREYQKSYKTTHCFVI